MNICYTKKRFDRSSDAVVGLRLFIEKTLVQTFVNGHPISNQISHLTKYESPKRTHMTKRIRIGLIAIFFSTSLFAGTITLTSKQDATLLDTYNDLQAQAQSNSEAIDIATMYASIVGDYADARARYIEANRSARKVIPQQLPVDAVAEGIEAVCRFTSGKRVVMLNEAHNLAFTRVGTIALLPVLRQQGFNVLALEALDFQAKGIDARGYPTIDDGTYTKEPVFGEMVRVAEKLGYKVVSYEASPSQGAVPAQREAAQAENLASILTANSSNRIVVHGGYAHIYRNSKIAGADTAAQRLAGLIGVENVISVDQTLFFDGGTTTGPTYTDGIQKWNKEGPFIMTAKNHPYSAEPEKYDVSVFFPRERLVMGRPTWLELDGLRSSKIVSADGCRDLFPCLVEAHYSNESDRAVAADRYVFHHAAGPVFLYTDRRPVTFFFTTIEGRRAQDTITGSFKLPYEN